MKDPAVLFYTQDFITGTILMSDEQRGKYIMLLCLQHQNGKLTERDMMKICGEKDEDIWCKFYQEDGYFYNKRMLLETQKRNNYTESRRRNLKKIPHMDVHMDSHMENENENEDINKNENKNIEKREIKFRSEVFEYLEKYPEEMLNKFCDYWTEKNASKTKMRFQTEKVFEVSRRLATWAGRDNKFVKVADEISYKELLYRFNGGETDIFEKYEPVTKGDKRSLWKLKTR
jgi:hypothetical protein